MSPRVHHLADNSCRCESLKALWVRESMSHLLAVCTADQRAISKDTTANKSEPKNVGLLGIVVEYFQQGSLCLFLHWHNCNFDKVFWVFGFGGCGLFSIFFILFSSPFHLWKLLRPFITWPFPYLPWWLTNTILSFSYGTGPCYLSLIGLVQLVIFIFLSILMNR